jgi:hypothetical protein
MLDTASESLLTLAEAADQLPRRRRGRKTHVSSLYRWTVSGCRGVVLESIQVGGTRCTSREALERFFDRLSGIGNAAPAQRSVTRRQRQSEAAEKKLKELGA